MIKNSEFGGDVVLNIAFYEEDITSMIEKIKNLTLGKASISFLKTELIDVIDE